MHRLGRTRPPKPNNTIPFGRQLPAYRTPREHQTRDGSYFDLATNGYFFVTMDV